MIFAIFNLLILSYSCSPKMATPVEADLERGSKKFPDLSMSELEAGQVLYAENCNLCHGYYLPNDISEDGWKAIVPKMCKKVNRKVGNERIDEKGQDQILKYVLSMKTN